MYSGAAIKGTKDFDLRKIILERLRWLIYIVLLGSLSSGLLLGVSYLIPLEEDGLNVEAKMLILKALDMDYSTENVEKVFSENIIIEEIEGMILYRNREGSIAFRFAGRGHQGTISGLIALGPDLQTLKGLVIREQQETPGLGGRITEEEFLSQFRGVVLDPRLVILPTGIAASADNEVEGITGATMTSKALEAIINQSIQEVIQKLEGK